MSVLKKLFSRSMPTATAVPLRVCFAKNAEKNKKPTFAGLQAYLRGIRVAVRHVAAFIKASRTAEEITREDLPHLPVSAIYEAVAYYYDHYYQRFSASPSQPHDHHAVYDHPDPRPDGGDVFAEI